MFALFSKKNGFVFVNQIWHFKALNQYSVVDKVWFRLLAESQKKTKKKIGWKLILKFWTNIPLLKRFDSGFWQTSEPIDWKLKYRENLFRAFQGLPRFSWKIFLFSWTKFGIFQLFTNIQWLTRFYRLYKVLQG